MIKKSIETVKRNPVILVWVLVTFIFEVALSILSMELFNKTSHPYAADSGISFIAVQSIITLTSIVYAIFLNGPLIYLAYEAAIGKVQKGWYATAIKRSLFRYLPLYVLFVFFLFTRVNIWVNILLFDSSIEFAYAVFIMPYINILVRILLLIPYYFITIPVMAEKRLGTGYKNVFAVGRKYFFAFILLYFFTYVSSSLFSILFSFGFYEDLRVLSYIMSFIRGGFSRIMIAALYIIGMNMYVEKRAELIKIDNKNTLKEEEG